MAAKYEFLDRPYFETTPRWSVEQSAERFEGWYYIKDTAVDEGHVAL
jgi:hypothetical protein